MIELSTTLGERIKEIREKIGENYAEFDIRLRGEKVKDLKNKGDYVRKLENGSQGLSLETLAILLPLCDWDAHYLIAGKKGYRAHKPYSFFDLGGSLKNQKSIEIMNYLKKCATTLYKLDEDASNIKSLEDDVEALRESTMEMAH